MSRPDIAEILAIAETGIELAQEGFGATLELEDAMNELEQGSDVWDMADTLRVCIEQAEAVAGELNEALQDARAQLRSYRHKFEGSVA